MIPVSCGVLTVAILDRAIAPIFAYPYHTPLSLRMGGAISCPAYNRLSQIGHQDFFFIFIPSFDFLRTPLFMPSYAIVIMLLKIGYSYAILMLFLCDNLYTTYILIFLFDE